MMTFLKAIGSCLVAIAMVVALGACGGGGSDSGDGSDAQVSTGRDGGGQADAGAPRRGGTLTMLSNEDVDFIDPGMTFDLYSWAYVSSATQRSLYAFRPDDPETLVPDLAAGEASIGDGGRTITVKLKRGVRFSPPVDRAVTSADVRYGLERGFTKNVANGYAANDFGQLIGIEPFQQGEAEHIAGIETPDPSTVVFKLSTPTAGAFLGAMTQPLGSPVPEDYARKFDGSVPSSYGQHQVATGPYMIENDAQGNVTGYRPNALIRLVRNPNWDPRTDFRPAYVDGIDIKLGHADPTVATRQIVDGESTISGNFRAPAAALQPIVDSDRADQVVLAPSHYVRYIALNTQLPPFDDIVVRKAVLAGFDREAMLLTYGGKYAGRVATHFLPPGMPGFEQAGGDRGTGVDYLATPTGDADLAAEYMRRAGFASGRYEDGERLFMVGANDLAGKAEAQTAKEQLTKLGFDVDLRLVASNTLYNKYCNVPSARVNVCPVGWSASYNDAESQLDTTFNGDKILANGNSNYPQLDVPELNRLFPEANQTAEPRKRADLWGEIDRRIVDQAPAVPWLWRTNANTRSENVVGVTNATNATWDLSYSWLR